MKTQIEIFDTNQTKNGVRVDYCLYDADGQANVTQTIENEKLEEYIIENDLNRYEFLNYGKMGLECDGLDEGYFNPSDYLAENLNNVVLAYLQSYLEVAA